VKIVDLNVLLYAVNADSPQHVAARTWWEGALNGEEPVGIAWIVILGFLRISTSPRVFPRPLTPGEAIAKIETWLSQENVRIVRESENHWDRLKSLLADTGTAGNLVSDSHLAALALNQDAVLATWDADFARFEGLRREIPGA